MLSNDAINDFRKRSCKFFLQNCCFYQARYLRKKMMETRNKNNNKQASIKKTTAIPTRELKRDLRVHTERNKRNKTYCIKDIYFSVWTYHSIEILNRNKNKLIFKIVEK